MGGMSSAYAPPHSTTTQPSHTAPWGKVDLPTFTTSIIKGSDMVLRGTSNWRSYRISFELLTDSCGLTEFLYGRVQIPTDPSLLTEFNHVNAALFNGLYRTCDETVRLDVEKFRSTPYSSAQAWLWLYKKHELLQKADIISLLDRLEALKVTPGKAEDYVRSFKVLRDALIAAGSPQPAEQLLKTLLKALPEEWEFFRENLNNQVNTLDPDDLLDKIIARDTKPPSLIQEGLKEYVFHVKNSKANRGKPKASSSDDQPKKEGGGTEKKEKFCTRCKKKGHWLSECFREKAAQKKKQKEEKGGKSGDKPVEKAALAYIGSVHANMAFVQQTLVTKAAAEEGKYAKMQKTFFHNNNALGTHKNEWILDSGCTKHMTPDREFFSDYATLKNKIPIVTGSGSMVHAVGKGTIKFLTNHHKVVEFKNTLHVPKLKANLISVADLISEYGTKIESSDSNKIVAYHKYRPLFTSSLKDGLFRVSFKTVHNSELAFTASTLEKHDVMDWHCRLGHPSYGVMKKMINKEMVEGVPEAVRLEINLTGKDVPKFDCPLCHEAKMTQKPYEEAEHLGVEDKLGLVHSDICGPLPPSKEGYKYFLTLTDDATRYKWIYFLKQKSEVPTKIKEWIPFAKTQSKGCLLRRLRTDNGGEFTSNDFEEFLKSKGIKHEYSIAFHPPQNGVAERINRTLVEKTRVMLLDAQLPVSYWRYAMQYATWLLNRTYSRALKENMTPYEAWSGYKPSLRGVWQFGSMAVGYEPKPLRDNKFSSPGKWLCFMGMSENHKGWILIDPVSKKEQIVRSAKFYDGFTLAWWRRWRHDLEKGTASNEFGVEVRPEELKVVEEIDEPLPDPPPRRPFTRSQGEVAAITVATDGVNVYTDDPIYMLKVLDLPADPKSVEEALAGPHSKEWKQAMDKEIETLVERGT